MQMKIALNSLIYADVLLWEIKEDHQQDKIWKSVWIKV